MSRPYPVHEAKARLSQILREVQHGATVTITDRGRPVAHVTGIPESDDIAARLDRLAREGALVRGNGTLDALRPVARRPGALRRFLRDRE